MQNTNILQLEVPMRGSVSLFTLLALEAEAGGKENRAYTNPGCIRLPPALLASPSVLEGEHAPFIKEERACPQLPSAGCKLRSV